jgi:crotonobetainyl-CoA:carnitine CoA-transferase CaiB-like acyl-CoA transferase
VGFPVSDSLGGMAAALAITASLAARHRTGQGAFLDVSMLEASVSAMGWAVSNYLVSGVVPEPLGDQNATAAPSGTFNAADGPLNIAANKQEQFEALCRLVERPDLLTDVRFADREARKLHRAELNQELDLALGTRTARDWEQLLPAVGVPAARILTVPQAIESPQLAHRDFFTDLPFPDASGRLLRVSSNGVLVNGQALKPESSPPLLGEHNNQLPALVERWRAARHPNPASNGRPANLTPSEERSA